MRRDRGHDYETRAAVKKDEMVKINLFQRLSEGDDQRFTV